MVRYSSMVIPEIFKSKPLPSKGDVEDVEQFLYFPKRMRLSHSDKWETRWWQKATIRVVYKENVTHLPGGFTRWDLVPIECCWIDEKERL